MRRLGDHLGAHLADIADARDDLWVLDGDLADSDGAVHFATRHPGRFIESGIAEQNMVSMAAGMASCGKRPWVFSFAAFLCYRAYDQIRVCVSQSCQPVTLVGSHAGGCAGRNGKSHASLNDIALMVSLPHMHVWAPADQQDVRAAVAHILEHEVPAYIRLPRRAGDELPGRASACRTLTAIEPGGIAVLSTGLATHLARAALAVLAERSQIIGHVHCPRLAPLPEAELRDALGSAGRVVVIDDHVRHGGLASLVHELNLGLPVVSLSWPVSWPGASGQDDALLASQGLDLDGIVRRLQDAASGRSHRVGRRTRE